MCDGRMVNGGERLRRQMTFGQYRTMDLAMLAAMMAVFETLIVAAATRWFPAEPYTVSVVPAITCIVMMRWGPWSGIHAALGGLVFCLASGARPMHYAVYGLGNLLSLAALGMLRAYTPEGIRASALKSLALAVAVPLLMQAGRAAIAIISGVEPALAAGFFTTDVVTLLFTAVLVWIVRRLDGVFEEQAHYLLRVHRQEKEKERGGF